VNQGRAGLEYTQLHKLVPALGHNGQHHSGERRERRSIRLIMDYALGPRTLNFRSPTGRPHRHEVLGGPRFLSVIG
jgi:hypothetical protein